LSAAGEQKIAPAQGNQRKLVIHAGAAGVWFRGFAAILLTFLVSCSGVQSALDPLGEEARQIAVLFWVMLGAGVAIWLFMAGLLLYALRASRKIHSDRTASRLIFWGGAVFPAVVLLLLLGYTLWLMPSLRPFAQAVDTALRVEVTGGQFWWRVVYHRPDGPPIISANEIRLPVGERVELSLKSADVIHSFWVPALGGKMDMIPGRTNRLSLLATKPGTFRGPCAEYCGTSHALMAFSVVVLETADFQRWLGAQGRPSDGATGEGAALFSRHGCGACHTIAGVDARGTVGPDLSHLGSRETVGAGILPNSQENIARFITEPDRIKPGSQMPPFGMLPAKDIRAIAAWLKELE
jgi:cytochrome c oxidase subunit II